MKKLPIGISDFKEIIEKNYYYADKSLLMQELIASGAKATLIPRPRRFGKTLNLSMLKYFFEKTEYSHAHLFKNLAISKDAESMTHQGQYPVIFVTFKDAKESTWAKSYRAMTSLIATEYERHVYVLEGTILTKREKENFFAITEKTADEQLYAESLKNLTSYLARYHKKNPIVLIDEYDAPIHAGFTSCYYNEVISFMRSLLSGCLKDNSHLEFAVMTGILRVAKESIFSGLNNLEVCTLVSNFYSDKFGLTEDEIHELLAAYNLSDTKESVRSWYNGYSSGKIKVYNPWSLLNFAKNTGQFGPYWINTSDNELIKECLKNSSIDVKEKLEQLIHGESILEPVNESIIFSDIKTNDIALWNFLLFSGYLTFHNLRLEEETTLYADFTIPNTEVLSLFKNIIINWFRGQVSMQEYTSMLMGLTAGDVEKFKDYFEQFSASALSYFDINHAEPERIYHALVLGMLVSLSTTHEVKSNRESGYGRYDVMLIPKDLRKPGIIIEFKKVNKRLQETIKEAAQRALEQINERHYEHELRERGITTIIKLGIAFEGKKVLVVEG